MVAEFEARVTQSSVLFEIPVLEIDQYRTTISKYSYALAYRDRESVSCKTTIDGLCNIIPTTRRESEEILLVRMRGYHLLRDFVEILSYLIIQLASSTVRSSIVKKKSPSTVLKPQPQLMEYLTQVNYYFTCHRKGKIKINCVQREHSIFRRLRGLLQIPEDFQWFLEAIHNNEEISKLLYLEVYQNNFSPEITSPNEILTSVAICRFFQHLPELMKQSIELSYELLHILLENLFSNDADSSALSRESDYKLVVKDIIEYLNFLFPILLSLLQVHPQRGLIDTMWHEYQQFYQYYEENIVTNL